jgi:hypothetical protein
MRLVIDVSTDPDGVMEGTAQWSEESATASFHGTLELVAVLERAVVANFAVDEPGSAIG